MVWMKMFCFCCSVRLGVIVCATISLIHASVSFTVLLIFGMSILNSAKHFIKREEQYNEDMVLWKILDFLSRESSTYMVIFLCILAIHIIDSLLAMYGAVKLRKWLLIPYVVSQSVLATAGCTQHVITMMILKNIVTLEMLIGYSLMGAFFMLFLTYSGATALSMFQIIVLINSEEYKALYGQDPFAPKPKSKNDRGMIKDLRIFYIPNKKEINRVKDMVCKQREGQTVIPVDTFDEKNDVQDVNFSDWHLNEVVCVGKGLK